MEGDMWCRVMVVMMVVARVTQAFPRQPVVDYSGWQVLEVEVSEVGSGEQPKVQLQDLDDTFNLQFLHQDRRRGVAEVALSPAFLTDFTQYLRNNNVKSTIIVDDLGKKLKSDIPFLRAESDLMGAVTFDRFMKYEEILEYLKELPRQYPDRVRLEEVGHSVESRPIHLLVISSDVHSSSTANKPVILIDGGIHAREWVSPAAVLYIVEQLLQSPAMTSDVEWRTLPLLNPDGYIYTWTKDRLWRKNRATTSEIGCVGVDLNRNFGFHFGESGTSPKPCSTVYHGPVAFSEPESQALRDTLQQESSRTKAYVTFHSYGQFVLHPWGYTDKVSKNNINELSKVGNSMARAIKKDGGASYAVGSPGELLYAASGGSDDWVAGIGKVPFVYTIELRDKGAAGFILPKELIKPTVRDAWSAIKRLHKHITNAKSGPRTAVVQGAVEAVTVSPPEADTTQEPAFVLETDTTKVPVSPPEADTTKEPVFALEEDTTKESVSPPEADTTKVPVSPPEADTTKVPVSPPEADTTKESVLPPEADTTKESVLPPEADTTKEPVSPPEADTTKESVLPPEADTTLEPAFALETDTTKESVSPPETDTTKESVSPPEADTTKVPVSPPEADTTQEPAFVLDTDTTKEPVAPHEADTTKEPVAPHEADTTKEPVAPHEADTTKEPVFPVETNIPKETETTVLVIPPETDGTDQTVVKTDGETTQTDTPSEPLAEEAVIRIHVEEDGAAHPQPDQVHICIQTKQTDTDLPHSPVQTDDIATNKQTQDSKSIIIIQVDDPPVEGVVDPEAEKIHIRIQTKKQETSVAREDNPVEINFRIRNQQPVEGVGGDVGVVRGERRGVVDNSSSVEDSSEYHHQSMEGSAEESGESSER